MTDLYLIRHGESITTTIDGHQRELGLSAEGVTQAQRLRDRLARTGEIAADVVISSPAQRATETAAILQSALGQPMIEDAALEEWRSDPEGILTDEAFAAMWRDCPDAQKPFFRFVPEGETWLECTTRVQTALNRILSEHDGKAIVIVAHGGVIQAMLVYFFGMSGAIMPRVGVDVRHTSITHWRKPDQRWILERVNDYHHLAP